MGQASSQSGRQFRELSKKVQKGITQFFDNGKNFFKKIIKSIDSEDIPEELSDEAKQLRQIGEDGLEYFRQLTTKGKIDPATEKQTMENVSNYIQIMRQKLSAPEYDDLELKETFLDMFNFVDDMMKKLPKDIISAAGCIKSIEKTITNA